MTDGMDEMPTTRMVNGIHSHTTATAAPVIIDADGTTPMRRAGAASATRCAACRPRLVELRLEVTATMPTT